MMMSIVMMMMMMSMMTVHQRLSSSQRRRGRTIANRLQPAVHLLSFGASFSSRSDAIADDTDQDGKQEHAEDAGGQ